MEHKSVVVRCRRFLCALKFGGGFEGPCIVNRKSTTKMMGHYLGNPTDESQFGESGLFFINLLKVLSLTPPPLPPSQSCFIIIFIITNVVGVLFFFFLGFFPRFLRNTISFRYWRYFAFDCVRGFGTKKPGFSR